MVIPGFNRGLLGLVGAALTGIALYTQAVSVDLSRYTLSQYLAQDLHSFAWWAMVPAPLCIGIIYLGIAILSTVPGASDRAYAKLLAVCLALAALLCTVYPLLGAYSFLSIFALFIDMRRKLRA